MSVFLRTTQLPAAGLDRQRVRIGAGGLSALPVPASARQAAVGSLAPGTLRRLRQPRRWCKAHRLLLPLPRRANGKTRCVSA